MKGNNFLYFYLGWSLYFIGCFFFVKILTHFEDLSLLNIFIASVCLLPGILVIRFYQSKKEYTKASKFFQILFNSSYFIFILGLTGFASIGLNRPFQYMFGLIFTWGFYMLIFSLALRLVFFIYTKIRSTTKTD